MQTRLYPLDIQRERPDYPQVNYVDDRGVQWIEINRGCKRQCPFCHADPNFKEFDIPEIVSNKVQTIGEGILYDSEIAEKIFQLSRKRVNDRVVYYGLSQGVDYRLLTHELISIMSQNRFGIITNKGHWKKGMRIAWDWGKEQETEIKHTIDRLTARGYNPKNIIVFALVNWKISYETCLYKLKKLKEWGVMIDDCTWDCTKKLFIPQYWTYKQYKTFRGMCREHNIEIPRNGYNPEKSHVPVAKSVKAPF